MPEFARQRRRRRDPSFDITSVFSAEELARNEEVSSDDNMKCSSLAQAIGSLERQGYVVLGAEKRDVPIWPLIATQPIYDQGQYDMLDEEDKEWLVDEPIVVLQTHSRGKQQFAYIGHVRSKKRFDQGRRTIPAYVLSVAHGSGEGHIEKIYSTRVVNLEAGTRHQHH